MSPTSVTQAQADCAASNAADLPSTPASRDAADAVAIVPYYDNSIRYILGPADMSGRSVAQVTVQQSAAGQYALGLTFTPAGTHEFDLIAAQRYRYYQQAPSDPTLLTAIAGLDERRDWSRRVAAG